MDKCRNCFNECSGDFCGPECIKDFEAKYFRVISSDNGSNYKTYEQIKNSLPKFEELQSAAYYPKIDDSSNGKTKPTYKETLEALPTFEELKYQAIAE